MAVSTKKKVGRKSKDSVKDDRKRIWVQMDATTAGNLNFVKGEVEKGVPAFFRGRVISDSAVICGLINKAAEECNDGKFSVDACVATASE